MTKIAIQPNASGTGTFTIAAPNSNTNRTFTLPDATGEVYTSGNILGTVSQDGGIPTGAIIERGSNANGDFVRYADGTQICTSNFFITGSGTRLETTWVFPSQFVNADHVSNASVSNNGANFDPTTLRDDLLRLFANTSPTVSGVNIGAIFSSSQADDSSFKVFVQAIGRWF